MKQLDTKSTIAKIFEVHMTENKSIGWQSVRQQLSDWSKPALIALVKDLYEASPDNRDFLEARFQAKKTLVRHWKNTGARSWSNSS
jgi:hypothetical protein